MNLSQFKATLSAGTPPEHTTRALQARWSYARCDWHTAHAHAQAQDDPLGAWVHAYLHRKEGDVTNARYWYRRAGRPVATLALEAEWDAIASTLLARTD